MKIVLIIITLLVSLCFAPAANASVLPELDDLTQESQLFTLFGDGGQEAWLVVHENLLYEDAGDILEGIGDILDLTPSEIHAWYRYKDNIFGGLPEEAHDFTYGIQYETDRTYGRFAPFLATEQVCWTSGPKIDMFYFGVGTEWEVNKNLTLRGAVWNGGLDWNDFGENHRITGQMNWNPHGSIEVNAMAWLMRDYGDKWGLWRLRVSHPVDNNLEVVLVYEGFTRSDATAVLIGFSRGL